MRSGQYRETQLEDEGLPSEVGGESFVLESYATYSNHSNPGPG